MRAADARKLIGKPVQWYDSWCPKNGFTKREGVVLDVKGRSVLIDQQGSNDWKGLSDVRFLKEKNATP